MKESIIQRSITDYLTMIEQTHKIYWFRSAAGSMLLKSGRWFKTGRPGCPDITICYNGKFIAVEVKSKTGKQSEAQKQAQADIEAAGGSYFVVRELSELKRIIEQQPIKIRSSLDGLFG